MHSAHLHGTVKPHKSGPSSFKQHALIGYIFLDADFVAHDIGFAVGHDAIYQVIEHYLHGPAALLMGMLIDGGLDKALMHHLDGARDGIKGDDGNIMAATGFQGAGGAVAA